MSRFSLFLRVLVGGRSCSNFFEATVSFQVWADMVYNAYVWVPFLKSMLMAHGFDGSKLPVFLLWGPVSLGLQVYTQTMHTLGLRIYTHRNYFGLFGALKCNFNPGVLNGWLLGILVKQAMCFRRLLGPSLTSHGCPTAHSEAQGFGDILGCLAESH